MKLAYCIHSLHLSRGIERGVSFRANYLCNIPGYEIYIITARLHGRPAAYPLDPRVKLIDLNATDQVPVLYKRFEKRLNATLNKIRPDIAISVGDNGIHALSKAGFGGKTIGEYHFSYEKYRAKYGKFAIGRVYADFRRYRIAKSASRMDEFVVLTKADKQDWARLVPSVKQIYNPCTIQEDGVAALDSKTIIAVGHLSSQKNYPDMLKAWEIVAQRHPDWRMKIYGDGSQRSRLSKIIRKRFPDGNVCLMGRCPDMEEAYLGSSALIMSSSYEGFPMVLLEAFHFGVPAVCYDCPKGPSEIIRNGESGYLVKLGDTATLADRICRIIEDSSLRKSMGTAAKADSEKYQKDAIMSEWQKLFDYLCNR